MMELRRMSLLACWRVISWRNAARAYMRTPTDDTCWSQFKFWLRVILNPFSPHRYRAAYLDGRLVAMVGLCNIVKGERAEISLITHPEQRGRGIGGRVVRMTVIEARRLGIPLVWGEVYAHNPACTFWYRLVDSLGGKWQPITAGRDGKLVPAYYFEVRP